MSLTEMIKRERREERRKTQREDDQLVIAKLLKQGWLQTDAEIFVRELREESNDMSPNKSCGLRTMQLGG